VVAKDKSQVIGLTAKAARSAANPEAAATLQKIATEMANHCTSDEMQRCKSALNSERQ
jgi:hypothetical protein